MFRHDRVYRAVAFSSVDLNDLPRVRSFLPKKSLSVAEPSKKIENCTVEHYFYYSPQQFTRNIEILSKARERWHGTMQYRYNLYLIGFKQKNRYFVVLGVPFWKMALDVYRQFRDATRGQGLSFKTIPLGKVLDTSKTSEDLNSKIKITRVNFNIEGDSNADSVFLTGTNLARCATLDTLIANLKGPTLVAQTLRMTYDDRFAIETDQFGNYRFRVSKHGNNLPFLPKVFSTLDSIGLVNDTAAFPYLSQVESANDDLEESNNE